MASVYQSNCISLLLVITKVVQRRLYGFYDSIINEYGAVAVRIWRGNRSTWKRNSSAIFSTTNTCPDPGLNPGHRDKKLSTVAWRLVNIMSVLPCHILLGTGMFRQEIQWFELVFHIRNILVQKSSPKPTSDLKYEHSASE